MLSDETLLLIEKFKSLNQEIPVVISKNRYKASKVCLQEDIYVNLQDIYDNYNKIKNDENLNCEKEDNNNDDKKNIDNVVINENININNIGEANEINGKIFSNFNDYDYNDAININGINKTGNDNETKNIDKIRNNKDVKNNDIDIKNNNETEIDFLSHCAYGETHDKYEKYKRVCIIDDGFTALNIKKDLNIVLIDGTKNLFKQFVIPAGILREPMSSIKYSNCVIISKTVKSNPLLEAEIKKYNNSCPIFYSYYAPTGIKGGMGGKETISFRNISGKKAKKAIIISGIGNPEYFYSNIKSCGFEIVYNFEYNDHYKYKDKDLLNIKIKLDNYLNNKYNNKNNKYIVNIKSDKYAKNDKYKYNDKYDKYSEDIIIITTLKDYVKLKEFKLKYPEIVDKLYYLDFEVKIDSRFYDFIIQSYFNYIKNIKPELADKIRNSLIKK
ncbi:MAG: tetraacyldisaccharide 4'-kinase [bacterium]